MRKAVAAALAIGVAGACTFDSAGHGASTGESTGTDVGTTAAAETTTSTGLPDETTTASTSSSEGDAPATTSTASSEDTAATESTDTGTSIEVCNGSDDDGDGAVDEYSPMNPSCNGCDYQVTVSGFVQSFCTDPLPWLAAQQRCESLGSTLATVASSQDNDEVFGSSMGTECWIGLSDAGREGAWVWTDGTPVQFEAWAPTQPNNLGNEDCGLIHPGNASWNDDECENAWPYVCRTPA